MKITFFWFLLTSGYIILIKICIINGYMAFIHTYIPIYPHISLLVQIDVIRWTIGNINTLTSPFIISFNNSKWPLAKGGLIHPASWQRWWWPWRAAWVSGTRVWHPQVHHSWQYLQRPWQRYGPAPRAEYGGEHAEGVGDAAGRLGVPFHLGGPLPLSQVILWQEGLC